MDCEEWDLMHEAYLEITQEVIPFDFGHLGKCG